MTLEEFVNTLPKSHRAHREFTELTSPRKDDDPQAEGRLVEMTDEVRKAWKRYSANVIPMQPWVRESSADAATIDRHFALREAVEK
jgi:hypothetical protein